MIRIWSTSRAFAKQEMYEIYRELKVLSSGNVFGKFQNMSICTNAFISEGSISRAHESQLLADAIPAESLPAGFVEVSAWSMGNAENVNMPSSLKDSAKVGIFDGDDGRWGHSFFLSAPFMAVHGLYQNINQQILTR